MNIEILKQARESKGKTQKDIADELQLPLSTYRSYEQGKREPNNEILCKIADILNVTTDYLLGRDTGEPETIDQLASEFNMTALEKKILDNYLSLPEDMRGDLMSFLQKSVKEVMEEDSDQ